MNRLLAIETSSERCSVALAFDGEVRMREHDEPLSHAERLLPSVRALLLDAGTELSALDAIVFGRGPGSFTSLRIGIGAVQGLAFGAGLPVIPLSSLLCVAAQVEPAAGRQVLVALDARMDEVFHCLYRFRADGIPEPLGAEAVSPPEILDAPEPRVTVAAGNGFQRYPVLAKLGRSLCAVNDGLLPSAGALLPLAFDWLSRNQPLPAERAQPVYVRNRVAEIPRD